MSSAQPNQFDLKGENDIQVQYSTSPSGEHSLTVDGKTHAGKAVSTRDTPIGTLVTVTTLISDRAGNRRLFSLLVPPFRESEDPEFTTIGIFSFDAENAVGHPNGALRGYEAIELKGTARLVKGASA